MAEMDSLQLTRRSIAYQADLRVLVLTFYPLRAIEHRALAAGAKRCLSKDSDVDELLDAIRVIHATSST
ncbi:hypothetical protein MUY27_20355 [Mucilaginibacter sp. RS28]|uniref:Response regulatory domain-containing protein n=1 Tax=Mucilaginibacter straminoryzae TaxID=2932774 RepID=A0A9X1X6Z6_9SPHI|nr:hypothetical protein [Mucilaginibacter straminoryzae]